VPAANLHITLKFLGDQPDERLAEVGPALAEAAAALPPFALALSGIGGFPGMERPRILWVGVADGALAARGLQERVEAALEHRGFARDARPWHPHVTIGRVLDDRRWRREDSAPLRRAVAAAAREPFGLLPVSRVALMRSDLSPSGARYSEIGSAALGAAS
jgi:2'-5' RNA ligase